MTRAGACGQIYSRTRLSHPLNRKMDNRLDLLLRESRERRRVANDLVARARSLCAHAAQTCEETRQLEKTLIAIRDKAYRQLAGLAAVRKSR